MTAEAIELIEKFEAVTGLRSKAKRCALIAVDEFLARATNKGEIKYWEEFKEAIREQ